MAQRHRWTWTSFPLIHILVWSQTIRNYKHAENHVVAQIWGRERYCSLCISILGAIIFHVILAIAAYIQFGNYKDKEKVIWIVKWWNNPFKNHRLERGTIKLVWKAINRLQLSYAMKAIHSWLVSCSFLLKRHYPYWGREASKYCISSIYLLKLLCL